jgi:iron complex transport system substrate-binding protein
MVCLPVLAGMVIVVLLITGGCEPTDPPRAAGQAGHNAPADSPASPLSDDLRIVSLSPAVTQMLIDLGLGQSIVAVGRFDPVAPAGAVEVGDLYSINYEALFATDPAHIFIQPQQNRIPGRLGALAQASGATLHAYRIDTVDDALAALAEGPALHGEPVGSALGMEEQARDLARSVRHQLDALRQATASDDLPSLLLLVGLNPMTAVGPGTFLDELIVSAGATNAAASYAIGWPVVDTEAVLAMQPDVIVLVSGTEGPSGPIAAPPALAGLGLEAVADGKIIRLADPAALLPSTAMPRIAGQLLRLIHPPASVESIHARLAHEHAPDHDH